MADKDTVTKDYMSDNATFADLFNFYIYGGHEVIVPVWIQRRSLCRTVTNILWQFRNSVT